MTPSETFVRAVNRYPKGSTITIGGAGLVAVLSMVASVFGFGHKVGEVKHDILDNAAHISEVERVVDAQTKAIIESEKSQAVFVSEFEYLKDELKEFRVEQKAMNREILKELQK